MTESPPELTVIIVSYNTRALTLKCLETLYANTTRTRFHTVVFDNASEDGSAEAVAAAFPQVEVIASKENLGFARANNEVAAKANSEWILLLNPDTEVYENGVDALLEFSRAHPEAGLTGGRTFFPDGSLNPLSCQGEITLWSSLTRRAWPDHRVQELCLLQSRSLWRLAAGYRARGRYHRRLLPDGSQGPLG